MPPCSVLSAVLTSLTPPVIGHICFLKTSTLVWEALDRMYASHSKAWIVQLPSVMVKPEEETSISEYLHS
jgi:hypothetical protein